MAPYGTLEYFPLQLFSFEDLQAILDDVIANFPQEWQTKVAERQWRKLAGLVREALLDAFLVGPRAKERWLREVDEVLARNEQKRSKRALLEIRIGYIHLLDRIYGATFRHVIRRVPTAVVGGPGRYRLEILNMFRYARVRHTAKTALEQLMEFIHMGGPRFEMRYSWQPMGEDVDMEEARQWRLMRR